MYIIYFYRDTRAIGQREHFASYRDTDLDIIERLRDRIMGSSSTVWAWIEKC